MKNKRIKVVTARALRKRQTEAEKKLWWLLRNRYLLGHKFRRQYVFRGFIFDFYCPLARVAIELDGIVHEKQKDYDIARQKFVEANGIIMLRFKNSELNQDPEKVLSDVLKQLPLSALSTKWRGGTMSEANGG